MMFLMILVDCSVFIIHIFCVIKVHNNGIFAFILVCLFFETIFLHFNYYGNSVN